jgi:hypothetical protein
MQRRTHHVVKDLSSITPASVCGENSQNLLTVLEFFFTWVCPEATDLMTTSSRSKTPSSLLSLSLYPNPETPKRQPQQVPHPFFPQHTPTKKFKIFFFFFFYLLSFSLFWCPQNPNVHPSVRPCRFVCHSSSPSIQNSIAKKTRDFKPKSA